jgi:hypothetical protein
MNNGFDHSGSGSDEPHEILGSCGECIYYYDSIRECRFNPPTVLMIPIARPGVMPHQIKLETATKYPNVVPGDVGCGEFTCLEDYRKYKDRGEGEDDYDIWKED